MSPLLLRCSSGPNQQPVSAIVPLVESGRAKVRNSRLAARPTVQIEPSQAHLINLPVITQQAANHSSLRIVVESTDKQEREDSAGSPCPTAGAGGPGPAAEAA